jgi:acyl-CoA dehydrogenase
VVVVGGGERRCKIGIFMGVTDPDADPYRQQSMILVPMDTPGVEVVRDLPVFGHYDGARRPPRGDEFTDVRVPASQPHRERGRRVHDRPGPARSRGASTTACG